MRLMLGTGAAALALAGMAIAAPAGDWPTYGHDKGGQRHSPLVQITPANVAGLQPAWTYHMRPTQLDAAPVDAAAAAQRAAEAVGPAPPNAPPGGGAFTRQRSRFAGSQSTPLVVNGVLYTTTPYGRVVALEPETGKEIWVANIPGPGQPSLRGVEYWPGDGTTPPRLFFGTRDGRLIALDAATGQLVAGFGSAGVIDMKTPEILNGLTTRQYGMTSPPIVWRNLVITGSAVQEFPPRGAAGDVRADGAGRREHAERHGVDAADGEGAGRVGQLHDLGAVGLDRAQVAGAFPVHGGDRVVQLGLEVRQVDHAGLAVPLVEADLGAGRHRLRLAERARLHEAHRAHVRRD